MWLRNLWQPHTSFGFPHNLHCFLHGKQGIHPPFMLSYPNRLSAHWTQNVKEIQMCCMPPSQTTIWFYNALVELSETKKKSWYKTKWRNVGCLFASSKKGEPFCNIVCELLFDPSRSTWNKLPSCVSQKNKVRGDTLNGPSIHWNPLTTRVKMINITERKSLKKH